MLVTQSSGIICMYASTNPPLNEGISVGPDHDYCKGPTPSIRSNDSSKSLETDPKVFLDRDFNLPSIRQCVKTLKANKAKGFDNIPNEALINSPPQVLALIVRLFNLIKNTGVYPTGWK